MLYIAPSLSSTLTLVLRISIFPPWPSILLLLDAFDTSLSSSQSPSDWRNNKRNNKRKNQKEKKKDRQRQRQRQRQQTGRRREFPGQNQSHLFPRGGVHRHLTSSVARSTARCVPRMRSTFFWQKKMLKTTFLYVSHSTSLRRRWKMMRAPKQRHKFWGKIN